MLYEEARCRLARLFFDELKALALDSDEKINSLRPFTNDRFNEADSHQAISSYLEDLVESVTQSQSGKETDRLIKELMYVPPFKSVGILHASSPSDRHSSQFKNNTPRSTYYDVEADMILKGRSEHILNHLDITDQIRRIHELEDRRKLLLESLSKHPQSHNQNSLLSARIFAAERELIFFSDQLLRLRNMDYQSSQLRHQIEDESVSWYSYKKEMEKLKEHISTIKAECLVLRTKICSAKLQACEEHAAAVRSVDALKHSAKKVFGSSMSDNFDLCQQFVQALRTNSSERSSALQSDARADSKLLGKTCDLLNLNSFPYVTDALLKRLSTLLSDSEFVQPVSAELQKQLSWIAADHNSTKTFMRNSSERENEVCAWLSKVLEKISETVSSASKKRSRSAYFWDVWTSGVTDNFD
uniref:Uncharacterized protein n=1 Tax=Schistocephalus solidus TaxID=70667 RepID=A0A0X3Q569_SCHSO